MKAFLGAILKLLKFLFPMRNETQATPTPTPKPDAKKGLFSMDLFGVKDKVAMVFDNPMTIGAFHNKVDLSKAFNLGFPCYLLPNSDQNYSLALVDGGIRLTFNKTCPKLYAEKFFSIETEIDFVFITKEYIRISLVGLPDFFVNLK